MTLDEAIKKAEEVVEEHRQLADWLKELKRLREQTRWIPVSERLPKENKTVIASTKYGVYSEAKYTKKYGWEWAYEAGVDYWEGIDEDVTAWMPLPERYKPQESEDKE